MGFKIQRLLNGGVLLQFDEVENHVRLQSGEPLSALFKILGGRGSVFDRLECASGSVFYKGTSREGQYVMFGERGGVVQTTFVLE